MPLDRVAWVNCSAVTDLDRVVAQAPPHAPAVVPHWASRAHSQAEVVHAALEEMESIAEQLFPAWLPGAEGLRTSAGAAPVAVRKVALAHAARTGHFGPFLADLAVGALRRRGSSTGRHPPEVRARGLARVLATGLGRPTCALLIRSSDELDERGALVLGCAAEWLVDHGRMAVWILGERFSPADRAPAVAARPPAETVRTQASSLTKSPARASRPHRTRAGKPHPTSPDEVALEAVLATRPWATGRAWNCTVRPGPLINPVRVDLLWERERCIVEIDGSDHRAPAKFADDRRRDVMLQLNGYAVLRFTNAQVRDELENVLALLQQFLTTRRQTRKGH
jgi:very-short-patch-repair endonuclease